MAERTGCPIFLNLWSYVEDYAFLWIYIQNMQEVPKCGANQRSRFGSCIRWMSEGYECRMQMKLVILC